MSIMGRIVQRMSGDWRATEAIAQMLGKFLRLKISNIFG
jgi:hypothetical protein